MLKRIAVAACVALLPLGNAPAEEIPPALRSVLAEILAGVEPDEVAPAAVEGLYRVVMGQDIVYFSADGRYALRGDLIDVESNRNLSEHRRRQARLAVLEELGEESMIVFAPSLVKYTVTVFTDVDCAYCAELHRQVADYNALGVAIRYAAFPRAGIPSPSYDKTVSVWCSDDPHRAIGDAKFGHYVPERTCENPVSVHYAAGHELGVRGTPTFVLESGSLLGGYVPPGELVPYLSGAADEG